MKALPLEKMPFSLAAFQEECRELNREQRAIVLELRSYIWRLGFLPIPARDVAAKVGLSERRWIRIAPAIAMHFDHDEDGRWRDFDLEEEREKLFSEAEKERERRADGKERHLAGSRKGGLNKAENERRRLEEEQQAERLARAEAHAREAGELPEGFAETLGSSKGEPRVDLGSPSPTLAEPYADPSCDPLGSGIASGGSIERSESDLEGNASSLDRSIQEPCRIGPARDARAAEEALPKGTLAANGKPAARVAPSDPRPTLGSDAPTTAAPEPTDADIVTAIERAGGDGLDTSWNRPKALKTARKAFREGLDLARHLVPEIAAFAKNALAGGKRLREPLNGNIMEAARARKRKETASPGPVVTLPVKVYVDRPENRKAYRLYLTAKGKARLFTRHDGGGEFCQVEPQLWADCKRRADEGLPVPGEAAPGRAGDVGRRRELTAEGASP